MRIPWKCCWLVLGVSTLAACSSDQPLAPGVRSISGHLRLTGYLVEANGQFAGTRVIGDADGVPVELLYGDRIVGRTTTVDGVYRFTGLRPGGYVARSRPIAGIEDETGPLVIADTDVASEDTLRLASLGDLFPIPNPFADTIRVVFRVARTTQVELDIIDIGGRTVQRLLALELLPAIHTVHWIFRNPVGGSLTDSLFWVTYTSPEEVRAQLLLRRAR